MSRLIVGDCVEEMAALDAESIDAIVCDPPYNLVSGNAVYDLALTGAGNPRPSRKSRGGGFMGKAWDGTGIAFDPATWAAALRVAKPGAYLLAFGGTRTVHRMTSALEDAGWIIRDMLVWGYATGFPKGRANLKPAWEPIVMARKPGPLRMLNIDGCRIGTDAGWSYPNGAGGNTFHGQVRRTDPEASQGGRWPANVILTDPIFDGDYPDEVVGGGQGKSTGNGRPAITSDAETESALFGHRKQGPLYDDIGGKSRYFLIPKASRKDRNSGINGEIELEAREHLGYGGGIISGRSFIDGEWTNTGNPRLPTKNTHPTVKPTELMKHLVRLVTPPGGLVLDPFAGSGTTGLACVAEGFEYLLIERDPEYAVICRARLGLEDDAARAA